MPFAAETRAGGAEFHPQDILRGRGGQSQICQAFPHLQLQFEGGHSSRGDFHFYGAEEQEEVQIGQPGGRERLQEHDKSFGAGEQAVAYGARAGDIHEGGESGEEEGSGGIVDVLEEAGQQ